VQIYPIPGRKVKLSPFYKTNQTPARLAPTFDNRVDPARCFAASQQLKQLVTRFSRSFGYDLDPAVGKI